MTVRCVWSGLQRREDTSSELEGAVVPVAVAAHPCTKFNELKNHFIEHSPITWSLVDEN